LKLNQLEYEEYNGRLVQMMNESIIQLKHMGIPVSDRIRGIEPNSRAKKRLGSCRKISEPLGTAFRIDISTELYKADDDKLKTVLMHELLHTVKGCFNHGKKWKLMAATVNREMGLNIKTTAEMPAGSESNTSNPVYRYKIVCQSCGNTSYRVKRSKVIEHPENYRCAKCGGKS